MEWYNGQAFEEETKTGRKRVLTNTSGNVQTFSSGSKRYLENDTLPSLDQTRPFREPLRHRYPAPQATLRSNDRRVILRQKLNTRRLKKRLRHAQAYLQHPKFVAFKARPRKDVIKDTGEVIWDDETEAAFQNAVINIPAMGRRKKSQHGKTLGRNELIAEWIKQETGRERTRKQVSSHIQTLDNLFKAKTDEGFSGIPEWAMITRGADDPVAETDGPEFYDNSIADMVRYWRMLQVDISQVDADIASTPKVPLSARGFDDLKVGPLSKLEFDMWVSLPDKMEEPLHKYTRTQSCLNTAVSEPLDQIHNWKTAWPDLDVLLERNSRETEIEIILIETSFELMLDFPPPRSKLGISLELDFTPCIYDRNSTDGPTNWICLTNIYQQGDADSETRHHICHCPGPGRVKPPFESKWWAEQFTHLTETRRHAIDSGNDAAVTAADEDARNYLSNVKIMQQISAFSGGPSRAHGLAAGVGRREVLAAVLLWSFSQASPKFVGTTTWRKLTLPTDRSNYPSPLLQPHPMDLPPLPPELHVEDSFDHGFEPGNGSIHRPLHPHGDAYMPDDNTDEELCQDGFTIINQHSNPASMPMPYHGSGALSDLDPGYQNQQAFQTNAHYMQQYQLQFPEHSPPLNVPTHNYEPNDHLQPTHTYQTDFIPQPYTHPIDPPDDTDWETRRQALLTFDTTTHKMLQAQLQDLQPDTHFDMRQTHSAPPTEPQPATEDPIPPLADTPPLHAPRAIRPSLHHHHSFAGVLTLDDATQHDFGLLLDGLDGGYEQVGFEDEVRPFSLPLPLAGPSEVGLGIVDADVGAEWVGVKLEMGGG